MGSFVSDSTARKAVISGLLALRPRIICRSLPFFVLCLGATFLMVFYTWGTLDDPRVTNAGISLVKYHDSLKYNGPNPVAEEDADDITNKEEDAKKTKQAFDDYAKIFHEPNANCANIFAGSKADIEAAINVTEGIKKSVPLLSNDYYINETLQCDNFIKSRGYITSSLTKEERDFPIAYSILVFKDAEMVDRLLRAIYRPQNFYCIHVDAKSNKMLLQAMLGIAICFPNVFVAPRQVDVQWGKFSVLEPELICMKELWSRSRKWKYFINLTGQEFPLKTNKGLVKILRAYDGANDLEATMKRANKERWNNTLPPDGLRPIKGSVHICVNRKYVDYVLHNDTAHRLLQWVKNIFIPDETFFATLNHNSQLKIPGSYKGFPETDLTDRKPFMTRFKNWGSERCAGSWVRSICILSTGDLPLLGNRKEMFANKFYLKDDRIAIGCLEEKHFNDTRDEYFGTKSFNVSFYENLGFVKNKVPVWAVEIE